MKRVVAFDLEFARDAIALVDERLSVLEVTDDGDADGSFDTVNYLAGFGFAALQTFTAGCSRAGCQRSCPVIREVTPQGS